MSKSSHKVTKYRPLRRGSPKFPTPVKAWMSEQGNSTAVKEGGLAGACDGLPPIFEAVANTSPPASCCSEISR